MQFSAEFLSAKMLTIDCHNKWYACIQGSLEYVPLFGLLVILVEVTHLETDPSCEWFVERKIQVFKRLEFIAWTFRGNNLKTLK